MAGEATTTTTAVPEAATYRAGPTYTTAADIAGRSYGGSADGLSLLAQRLQALTDDGVKSEHSREPGQGVQGACGAAAGGPAAAAGAHAALLPLAALMHQG